MRFYFALVIVILVASTPFAHGQTSGVLLEEMTWTEVRDAIDNGVDTVIITVGATEQHGPQIALASDSVTGDFIGPEIAKRIGRAVVASGSLRITSISPARSVREATSSSHSCVSMFTAWRGMGSVISP
jgi:hypothetical protein